MKKQIITLAVATLLLSSCGIYTKYERPEIKTDGLYGQDVEVEDTRNYNLSLSMHCKATPTCSPLSGASKKRKPLCHPPVWPICLLLRRSADSDKKHANDHLLFALIVRRRRAAHDGNKLFLGKSEQTVLPHRL